MKIVMNRLEALSLAKAAESIAPSKATMDELRCVLLESGEDGKLTMAATNNEVALEQRPGRRDRHHPRRGRPAGGDHKRYMPLHHPDPACVQLPPRGDPLPGGHRDRQEYPQHGRPDGLCGRGE